MECSFPPVRKYNGSVIAETEPVRIPLPFRSDNICTGKKLQANSIFNTSNNFPTFDPVSYRATRYE